MGRLGKAKDKSKAWRRASGGMEKDGGSWLDRVAGIQVCKLVSRIAPLLHRWSGRNEVKRTQTRTISLAGNGAADQTWHKLAIREAVIEVPAC